MLILGYIALNFFQPGIFFKDLSGYSPMFWASVVVGLPALINKRINKVVILCHWISLLVLCFVLAQILSVYYGGLQAILDEFLYWYIYSVFVFLIAFSIDSFDHLRKAVWGLVLGGGFVVLYGIYAVHYDLPSLVSGRAGAYGMYENHNDYTFLIVLILPFIWKLYSLEQSLFKRFILLLLGGASVLGVFLSLSRGGMIALLLELLILVWFYQKKKIRFIFLMVMIVAGIFAIQYQWTAREENQEGSAYTAERAQYLRMELWRTGWKMVKDRPLLGVGSRRFREYSQKYTDLSYDSIGRNSHNTYVEVFSTSGLVGFLPFIGFSAVMLRELLRKDLPIDPSLNLIREGLIVALISLHARSLLDAKPHEWGFYLLAAFTLVYVQLRNSTGAGTNSSADLAASLPNQH